MSDPMFLHAALDRFLTQMGNSYSGTKPALPTLNINKVSSFIALVGVAWARCSKHAVRLPIARPLVKTAVLW